MANEGPSPQLGYARDVFGGDIEKKFLCNSCNLILRDPVQSYCGHRFCKTCIDDLVRNTTEVQCKTCIEEGAEEGEDSLIRSGQTFPDNAIKREMQKKPASCPNFDCPWEGIFREYESHCKDCKFRTTTCPNGCNIPVSIVALKSHQKNDCPKRVEECKFCQEKIIAENRQSHLDKNCLKVRVKCDVCGKKKIPRDHLEVHKTMECSGLKLDCPACGASNISRDNFLGHLTGNENAHVAWTMKQVSPESLSAQLESVVRNYIPELERRLQRMDVKCNTGNSITQQQPLGDDAAKSKRLAEETPEDNPVNNAITALNLKTATFESIVGVLHREIERALTAINAMDRRYKMDQETIQAYERKLRDLERSTAQKDTILAELDSKMKNSEFVSTDGTLLWKITEFAQKRNESLTIGRTSIYSSPFYTSKTGFKMCVRLYPNGDGIGKNTHLSLFFVIMKGTYDALMPWPFRQKVTLMILDQNNREHVIDSFLPDSTSSSFKQPTNEMNIASGCPLFVEQSCLLDSSRGYVKNDNLFVKVVVEKSDLEEKIIGNSVRGFNRK